MIITKQSADLIVSRVSNIVHHNINVIDQNGVIISSSDKQREGKIHKIALKAAEQRSRINIYDYNDEDNVIPGINHPIIINNQVQIVLGISGNPNEIGRYAELAILAAELLITHILTNQEVNWMNRFKDIELISLINNYNLTANELNSLVIDNFNLELPATPYLCVVKADNSIDFIKKMVTTLSNKYNLLDVFILGKNEFFILINSSKFTIDILISIAQDFKLRTPNTDYQISQGFKAYNIVDLITSIRYSRMAIEVNKFSSNYIAYGEKTFDIIMKSAFSSENSHFFEYIYSLLQKAPNYKDLIKTIEVFIDNNFQYNTTAKQLNIHRNTLQHRIKIINDLVGLNLKNFKDSLILFVLIKNCRK